jgi:hypothetical protein
MDQIDTVDVYGTFTESEAGRNQIESLEEGPSSKGNIGLGKSGKGYEGHTASRQEPHC